MKYLKLTVIALALSIAGLANAGKGDHIYIECTGTAGGFQICTKQCLDDGYGHPILCKSGIWFCDGSGGNCGDLIPVFQDQGVDFEELEE